MTTSAKIAATCTLLGMLLYAMDSNVCGLLLNGFVFIGIILLNK